MSVSDILATGLMSALRRLSGWQRSDEHADGEAVFDFGYSGEWERMTDLPHPAQAETLNRPQCCTLYQGQTGPPGTCQVGRLVRRPGGPPRQMLK